MENFCVWVFMLLWKDEEGMMKDFRRMKKRRA